MGEASRLSFKHSAMPSNTSNAAENQLQTMLTMCDEMCAYAERTRALERVNVPSKLSVLRAYVSAMRALHSNIGTEGSQAAEHLAVELHNTREAHLKDVESAQLRREDVSTDDHAMESQCKMLEDMRGTCNPAYVTEYRQEIAKNGSGLELSKFVLEQATVLEATMKVIANTNAHGPFY